jgi:hypothetical protein
MKYLSQVVKKLILIEKEKGIRATPRLKRLPFIEVVMDIENKKLNISEDESLVLWKALELYSQNVEGHKYETTLDVLAKVIHLSCDFSDTNDGQTVADVYNNLIS